MNTREQVEQVLGDKEKPAPSEISAVPIIINLEDVKSEKVEWLWDNRIPKGKLTIIEGDPGVGKSWITMALACSTTLGSPLPGDQNNRSPANVLILSAEDGLGDTIKPRLEGMGADISKVKIFNGVKVDDKERNFSITDDIKVLDQLLSNNDFALVVIDPINAYLGTKIDSHKDTAMRSALMPLAKVAEKHGIGLVCIRHLTKGSKDRAIYRGQGHIAYTEEARVVLLVGALPEDSTKRAMVPIKNNLAPLELAIEFQISEGRFTWGNESMITADMLLQPSTEDSATGALGEASDFLLNYLAEGEREAAQAFKDASKVGISDRTLKRAKASLGVVVSRSGFGKQGKWAWKLPPKTPDAKGANLTHGEDLAPLDTNEETIASNPNIVHEVFGTDAPIEDIPL